MVILTTDEDFVEIFWKLQWFLDTHYRAYHAAKMVKSGRFGEPDKDIESELFDDPLTLYRRQTLHLDEVLPRNFSPARVSVIYVGPKENIKIGFQFEREMVDMLEMRSRTFGRCTDQFDDANIHVDLGPVKTQLRGLFLGIGRDAGRWVQTDDTRTFLAYLDQEHSLHCRERFSRG